MAVTYRFGDYRLDRAARCLWRGQERVAVPAKVFDCLVYLILHRERAVGRDELISAVWGVADAGDGVLGQTILQARKALDDSGKEQRTIRTVTGFGYQWMMPVTSGAPDGELETPAPVPVAEVDAETGDAAAVPPASIGILGHRLTRRAVLALCAALLVVVLGFVTLHRHGTSGVDVGAPTRPAIVLPVAVTPNGGEQLAWIRLGVMDLIAEKLRASGMMVVPSETVVALIQGRQSERDAAQRARDSGAGLLVSARAELVGNRWRVRIEAAREPERPLVVSAESEDVLDAATIAAHRLSFGLGLVTVETPTPDPDRALQALLKQLDGLLLAGDPDAASRRIEAAPAALKSNLQVQIRVAHIAYQNGNWDDARRLFGQIVVAASTESEHELKARALTGLGAVALSEHDFVRAYDHFDAAIRLLGDEDLQWRGNALNGRAASLAARRLYEPALADFARARAALEQTGDALALATLDVNLAALASSRDDLHEAAAAFARVAQRFRSYDASVFELDARINAMQVNLLLLDLPAAREDNARLVALLPSESNPARRLRGEVRQYELLMLDGAIAEGDVLLQRLRDEVATITDTEVRGDLDVLAGERALALGRLEEASQLAERAAQRPDDPNDPHGRARAALLLVRTRLAANDVTGAAQAQRALAAWFERDNVPVANVYAALAASWISGKRGDAADASRQLQVALAAAEASRVPFDIVAVISAGTAEITDDGPARLAALAQHAAPWVERSFDASLAQVHAYHALGWTAVWKVALTRTLALAGERRVSPDLMSAPTTTNDDTAVTRSDPR
jgi:DNA-binding winged helix-turn-helix (wHTH) protein/tetratricopeptide (TPR) repeat protein